VDDEPVDDEHLSASLASWVGAKRWLAGMKTSLHAVHQGVRAPLSRMRA
jgi:hypothetical protein